MASDARIITIDYDPPGRDVQGEYAVIWNMGTTTLELKDWTLRDIAPIRPHIYTFKQLSLPPGRHIRVWTKAGADTATDIYLNLGTAVWNNPGDTAILRDAGGVEVSRLRFVRLPAGAAPLRIAVPAYWPLGQKYDQAWQDLKRAGSVVSITVIEGSWPETAKNDAAWKGLAQAHLNALPGAVLGYVYADRDAQGNLLQDVILDGANKKDSVKAWYDQFSQQIDGIYFDELVLPGPPNSVSQAETLIAEFKKRYPNAKAMILAGQCIDERVVGPNIDWTALWETDELAYRTNFYPLVNDPQAPGRPIPSWWKNPTYRQKIVHIVHNCAEPDRQHTLGLANERNAGHVFVMDRRGFQPGPVNNPNDPNDPKNYRLYDHLPPYWDTEVREADSYYDFGFDPQRALLAARRYGASQGKFHAWPNFEAAWYPLGHVRGTFLLDAGPHAAQVDILQANLPGTPSLFNIPALWSSAHQYAQAQGYETAIPTFEEVQTPNGLAFRLILFAKSLPWLTPQTVPLASTYQQPTFAEPGAVTRNINRWATSNGYKASFPTFAPDDAANPRGRKALYNCYVLSNAAPVSWQDVPTVKYIEQL